MNETFGFSKQCNVCIKEIISLHFGVMFGYAAWIATFFRAKSLIKSLKFGASLSFYTHSPYSLYNVSPKWT